ncbi:helix-turn-helix domain-containing protein [Nocardioides sp. BGMRC 2183]|nr:helix-turn-helix domain-containing protein [Nocardioides sp. BGMRC 2183]
MRGRSSGPALPTGRQAATDERRIPRRHHLGTNGGGVVAAYAGGQHRAPARFLSIEKACGYLGVSKATLLTWPARRSGYGPRAVKAGGRLKYRLSELNRWLEDHEDSFAEEQLEDARDVERSARPSRKAVRTRTRSDRWQPRESRHCRSSLKGRGWSRGLAGVFGASTIVAGRTEPAAGSGLGRSPTA